MGEEWGRGAVALGGEEWGRGAVALGGEEWGRGAVQSRVENFRTNNE